MSRNQAGAGPKYGGKVKPRTGLLTRRQRGALLLTLLAAPAALVAISAATVGQPNAAQLPASCHPEFLWMVQGHSPATTPAAVQAGLEEYRKTGEAPLSHDQACAAVSDAAAHLRRAAVHHDAARPLGWGAGHVQQARQDLAAALVAHELANPPDFIFYLDGRDAYELEEEEDEDRSYYVTVTGGPDLLLAQSALWTAYERVAWAGDHLSPRSAAAQVADDVNLRQKSMMSSIDRAHWDRDSAADREREEGPSANSNGRARADHDAETATSPSNSHTYEDRWDSRNVIDGYLHPYSPNSMLPAD